MKYKACNCCMGRMLVEGYGQYLSNFPDATEDEKSHWIKRVADDLSAQALTWILNEKACTSVLIAHRDGLSRWRDWILGDIEATHEELCTITPDIDCRSDKCINPKKDT